MAQIDLNGISKRFKVYERPQGRWGLVKGAFTRTVREVRALDGVGFQIDRGELVGYIGPNGAGKSTTVKVMSGILTPDGGVCTVSGRIPWKERVEHVSRIGVVFGQRSQLWWDVPVSDSFELLKDIYDIPAGWYRERLSELTDALDIESCSRHRRASCRWANGCAASWRRRCCTDRTFSFWTSRPSG